jgi:hypothetical protein
MRSAVDIQADLEIFYSARRAVALSASYTLDTGQGRQSVTRADLASINATIASLESELSDLDGSDTPISFERDSV